MVELNMNARHFYFCLLILYLITDINRYNRVQMDHVPSQSISKSVLFATPFFLIVLAVLHASSEVSYMFVLNFINNVAGSADLTFLPSTKPEVSHQDFTRDSILNQYGLEVEA